MPPIPSVSPIVWRSPYLAGISWSITVARWPPTWTMLIAKSASSSAWRRSAWASIRGEAPASVAVTLATPSAVSSRSASMS